MLILESVRDSIHYTSHHIGHTNTESIAKKLPITTLLLNHTLNVIKVEMRKSADGRTEGVFNKENEEEDLDY